MVKTHKMTTKNPAAVELGRRGGNQWVKNTTAKERREQAGKAAKARWEKAKKKAKP